MGDEADAAEAAYWEWSATAPPGATSDPHYFDNEGSPTRDRVYAARERIHGPRTRRSYVCAYNEDELTGGNGMGDLADAYERHIDNEWEAEMRERLTHASPQERETAAAWGRGVLKSFFGPGYEPSDHAVAEMAMSYNTRTGGSTTVSTKLEDAQKRLETMLREAQAQADEVERLANQARTHPEPGDGMVVYFSKYFPRARGGEAEYEFAAIRKHDRWYHTGKSEFLTRHGLPQPCTWDELIEFAHEISVVTKYAPVDVWEAELDAVLDGQETVKDNKNDLNSEAWVEHDKAVEREIYLVRTLTGLRDLLDNELAPGKRPTKEALRDMRRCVRDDLNTHAKMKEGK